MNLRDIVDGKFCIGAEKALAIHAGGPGSGRRKTVGYDPTRPPNKEMERRDTEQVDRGYIKGGGPGSGRHAVGDRVQSHVWKPGTPNSYRETGTVTKAFVKGNPAMGKVSGRQTVHVKVDPYPSSWSGSGGGHNSIGPGENWKKI
jgi:hypothetical protein